MQVWRKECNADEAKDQIYRSIIGLKLWKSLKILRRAAANLRWLTMWTMGCWSPPRGRDERWGWSPTKNHEEGKTQWKLETRARGRASNGHLAGAAVSEETTTTKTKWRAGKSQIEQWSETKGDANPTSYKSAVGKSRTRHRRVVARDATRRRDRREVVRPHDDRPNDC